MIKNDTARSLHQQLLVAGVLLTRLPLPTQPRGAYDNAGRAAWAYPVVGAGIGLLGAIAGSVALGLGLPSGVAAGIILLVIIVTSGAMHEDGLADCADGFWGGTDPARRLEIMRDSQIGTFGVLALLLVTALRWAALAALLAINIWVVVAAAALSRGMMPWVMSAMTAARKDGLSRNVGAVPARTAGVAAGAGLLIGLICVGFGAFLAFIVAAVTTVAVMALARAKIDGQTGDVLGATQQVTEAVALLTFLALLT